MIEGAKDYVPEPREVLAVVPILFDSVAVHEPATMNPEQHRSFPAIVDSGCENVDPETILADVIIIPVVAKGGEFVLIPVLHSLRRRIAPPERRVHLGPRLGFLRRQETVCSGGIRSIGHAEEVMDTPEHVSSDLSV